MLSKFMVEVLTNTVKEFPYSKGEVVMVLRDVGEMERQEEAGIVFDIEPSGRVFVNYGGVVSLLHDDEQIRKAPQDIEEALRLRLKQNESELYEEGLQATSNIRGKLMELRENDTFFKWLKNSIKSH